MTAFSAADLIIELDDAIATSSSERCARMLSRTAEMLVAGNDRLQEMQISVLDDVLVRLTGRAAPSALVQLSTTLAELRSGPRETLRQLASCDDLAIAGPVLRKSPALSAPDLVTIAMHNGEDHLRAIASRTSIAASVTEVLVQRGSCKICLDLIGNPGAEFSDAGFATLIGRAEQDEEITKALVLRPGTPDAVIRNLLSASPQPKVPSPSISPVRAVAAPEPVAAKRPPAAAYAAARPEIVALNRTGKLNDSTVNRFAIRGETANLFTALSVLSGTPIEIIEHIMAATDCEGLVMACRASRLNWQTTLAILNNRGARLSFGDRERAQNLFETLILSTSQWAVRWGEIASESSDRATKSGGSR